MNVTFQGISVGERRGEERRGEERREEKRRGRDRRGEKRMRTLRDRDCGSEHRDLVGWKTSVSLDSSNLTSSHTT